MKSSFLIVHISSSFIALDGSLFPQCPGMRGHSSPMSVRVKEAVTRQCWMGALQIQSQVCPLFLFNKIRSLQQREEDPRKRSSWAEVIGSSVRGRTKTWGGSRSFHICNNRYCLSRSFSCLLHVTSRKAHAKCKLLSLFPNKYY